MEFVIDGVKFNTKDCNVKELIHEIAELLVLLMDYDKDYPDDESSEESGEGETDDEETDDDESDDDEETETESENPIKKQKINNDSDSDYQ